MSQGFQLPRAADHLNDSAFHGLTPRSFQTWGTKSPKYEVWCGVVCRTHLKRWFAERRQSCSRSASQESVASRHQAWCVHVHGEFAKASRARHLGGIPGHACERSVRTVPRLLSTRSHWVRAHSKRFATTQSVDV